MKDPICTDYPWLRRSRVSGLFLPATAACIAPRMIYVQGMSLITATIRFGPVSGESWKEIDALLVEATRGGDRSLLPSRGTRFSKQSRRIAALLADASMIDFSQDHGVIEAVFDDAPSGREELRRIGLNDLLRSYGISYDMWDTGEDGERDGAIESWRPAMGDESLVRHTTATGRPVVTEEDLELFSQSAAGEVDPNRSILVAIEAHLAGPTPLAEMPFPDEAGTETAPQAGLPASVAEAMNRR